MLSPIPPIANAWYNWRLIVPQRGSVPPRGPELWYHRSGWPHPQVVCKSGKEMNIYINKGVKHYN
jgi:hypothetical protein